MRSRRVLGFSAEHALFFTRNGSSVNPSGSALVLRPLNFAALSTARPCLPSEAQYSRDISSRCFQTSTFRAEPRKVSLHPTSSNTTSLHALAAEVEVAVPLSHQFRNMMRLLTNSVVVCTSTHVTTASRPVPGSADGTLAIPRAMTMSSFTSLALNPTPAVSFNIATPSRTLDAIKSSRLFNIHVLAADVSGAKVANRCRQGNEGALQLFARLKDECQCDVTMGSESAGPAMLQGPGVLHILRCKLLDEPTGGLVRVRDHVIVLGEVMEIVDGGGQDDSGRDFGLAYADTKYREPGRSIRAEPVEAVVMKESE